MIFRLEKNTGYSFFLYGMFSSGTIGIPLVHIMGTVLPVKGVDQDHLIPRIRKITLFPKDSLIPRVH